MRVGAIEPVGITNASASNPRIKSARMNATTIDSNVSRCDSTGLAGASVLAGEAAVGLARVAVRLIVWSSWAQAGQKRRVGRSFPLSNVTDFAGIGNPIKLAPEHLERKTLAR